ncbi:MAG: hypothetical protein ABIP41_05470 [Croceibacterium sp.]
MNKLLFASTCLAAAPALADVAKIKSIVDARLRYESLDQIGRPKDADTFAARLRGGFEAN